MASSTHAATVDDIPFDKPVITLPASQSVVDAFEVLVKNHILSAPVIASNGTCLGFFDVQDFTTYVVDMVDQCTQKNSQVEIPNEFCDLKDLLNTLRALYSHSLDSIVNISGNDPFVTVSPGTSLQNVMSLMALKSVHRVAVVDPASNKITKIISQSSIIHFLCQYPNVLAAIGEKTVEQAGIAKTPVSSIRVDEPVLDAYRLMRKLRISGLAVVEENGKILTCISHTDFRSVVAGKPFKFLDSTVLEFIQKSRSLDGPHARPAIICVYKDTKLVDVVKKMSAAKLHRVYVVDPHNHVATGVISLKDILRYLLVNSTD